MSCRLRILAEYDAADKSVQLYSETEWLKTYLFHSAPPFERNLVCYMGKYDADRAVHPDFRKFIDPLMTGLLFPYLDSERYKKDASFRKQVASVRRKIDLRTLKPLCVLRLYCSWLFRMKRRIVTIWNKL